MKTTWKRLFIHRLIWPFAGFAMAIFGGALNVTGWYFFESRILAMVGFFVCAAGILFGIIAIMVMQLLFALKSRSRDLDI